MHTDSIQWEIEVEKKDIAYIVSIFDGYENLAVVRTLDASRGLIELLVSPDYLEDTCKLIEAISTEIPFCRRRTASGKK
jgi:hypothetical protein